MTPNLYKMVGGLRTTILPRGKSALRNAGVTSREPMVLNLDDDAHDKRYLNIQVSKSVVVIFPYVSLVCFPQATMRTLYFSGLIVKTNLCWQLDVILPLKLSPLPPGQGPQKVPKKPENACWKSAKNHFLDPKN